MRTKKLTAALTALALTMGSINFPVNLYAQPEHTEQESMEQQVKTKQDSEENSSEQKGGTQKTTKTDAEPESIVQILKDNKYGSDCVLAKDETRIALRNPDGKLVIFDGQKAEEKVIFDKEGNELKIALRLYGSEEISSYFVICDKDNQKQLSDMDGNLFRNGEKFYQNINILDNKYVIYSEDGENFFVSTFDSDENIGEFKKSEYGDSLYAKYGFTNCIEKIKVGNATYYAVAETKDLYGTYTIFDENFRLLTKHIDKWSIVDNIEYFDDVFLACRVQHDIGEDVEEFLFNSQYECVDMNMYFTNTINTSSYSYFENDKNYIGKNIYSNNTINGDIVDRNYKRVFDGIVDLQYYAKDDSIWNEDGSWIGAAIGKIITVTSEDGTVNYYIYKDGEFHCIAQGMKLIDVKAEYSLYEADGRQELYYWNEKVWSGSDKYQEIQLQDTYVVLVQKELQPLYDIYIPENRKIEFSNVSEGFKIKNHRFLGKSNGKILFYDLEKEEIIYSIDEASMEGFISGNYNSGSISIKTGEVHDMKYDGYNEDSYPVFNLQYEIGHCYAYPGIYISENLQDYQTYQVLGNDFSNTYKPCINSSGYVCIVNYHHNNQTNIITKQAVYTLEINSKVLTYTDKYIMYYYYDYSSDNIEMKVFFLNLETGNKISLNDLLNKKYSSLVYGNKNITYDLNNVSIVQNMGRFGGIQKMDIIDGKNIYLNISGTSNGQDTVPITLVLDGINLEVFNIYPGNIIYNEKSYFITYDGNKMYQVDKKLKKVTRELELTVDNIECEDFYISNSLAVYSCQGKHTAVAIEPFVEIKISELENVKCTYNDILYGYNKKTKKLEIYDVSIGKLIKEVPAEDYNQNNYSLDYNSNSYFEENSDIGKIHYFKIYVNDEQRRLLAEVYYDKDGNELDIEMEGHGEWSIAAQRYATYYIKSKDKCIVTDLNGNICATFRDVPEVQPIINGKYYFSYSACLEDGTRCLLDSNYHILSENQDFVENWMNNHISCKKFEINGKIYFLLENDTDRKTYSLYDETYSLIANEITSLYKFQVHLYNYLYDIDDNEYKEGVYYTNKGIYYISKEGPVFYESAQSLCKLNDNYIAVAYKDNTDIIDRETLQTIYQIQGCYKFQLYTERVSRFGPSSESGNRNQYYAELIENYYLAYTEEDNKTVYYLVYFGADKQILDKDGLLVIADKNAQLPEDTILSVKEITDSFVDEDILNKFKEDYILNLIYDISLYQGENEIQIKDSVTVMIPVPETEKQGYKVFRIEEDGSLTDMKAVQKDNYLLFIAEHFSKYAVVQNKFTLGDVNKDGKINIKDSALTRRHVAKWKVDINLAAADVNKDGTINIKDSALIRRYVAKWMEEF